MRIVLWFLRSFEARLGNLGKHQATAFSCFRDLQPVVPEPGFAGNRAGVQVQFTCCKWAWVLN